MTDFDHALQLITAGSLAGYQILGRLIDDALDYIKKEI